MLSLLRENLPSNELDLLDDFLQSYDLNENIECLINMQFSDRKKLLSITQRLQFYQKKKKREIEQLRKKF